MNLSPKVLINQFLYNDVITFLKRETYLKIVLKYTLFLPPEVSIRCALRAQSSLFRNTNNCLINLKGLMRKSDVWLKPIIEQVRKPIFSEPHSECSEESYKLKVYEIPKVRFFTYAQNDSNSVTLEFPRVLFIFNEVNKVNEYSDYKKRIHE